VTAVVLPKHAHADEMPDSALISGRASLALLATDFATAGAARIDLANEIHGRANTETTASERPPGRPRIVGYKHCDCKWTINDSSGPQKRGSQEHSQ
jgi:hypothetical protein